MTRRRGDPFNSGNRGIPPPGLKGPKGKKFGRKAKGTGKRVAAPLIEQPVAESAGAVPCRICGYPVDPSRLHFHMVRFHGAAMRAPRL